jgi:hypothetical protein
MRGDIVLAEPENLEIFYHNACSWNEPFDGPSKAVAATLLLLQTADAVVGSK